MEIAKEICIMSPQYPLLLHIWERIILRAWSDPFPQLCPNLHLVYNHFV